MAGVVLNVADVDEMHFAAGDFIPGETGGASQRFRGFEGKRLINLLSAERHVSKRVVFRQTGSSDWLAFVAASLMQLAEFEDVFVLQIDDEKDVVRCRYKMTYLPEAAPLAVASPAAALARIQSVEPGP